MSQPKMDRVSHPQVEEKIEAEIIAEIMRVLAKSVRKQTSGIKSMARDIGVNPRTLKAWREGRNVPSLYGYILLCRRCPELVYLFLDLCQKAPRKRAQIISRHATLSASTQTKTGLASPSTPHVHVGNDVGNQKSRSDCNPRQLWFMLRIEEGAVANAQVLADCWQVSVRTAERDITALQKSKLIEFSGTKRIGSYKLT